MEKLEEFEELEELENFKLQGLDYMSILIFLLERYLLSLLICLDN